MTLPNGPLLASGKFALEVEAALSHNDLVSDAVRDEYRNKLLPAAEADLEHLIGRIDAAKVEAQDLPTHITSELSSIQEKVQLYRSPCSSLRKLPNETLLEIFGHCVTNGISIPYRCARDDAIHHTLILICTKWTALVLNTPDLWCNVSITYDVSRFSEEDKITRIAKAVILRSGNSPLSLNIQSVTDAPLRNTYAISDLVISNIHRLICLKTSDLGDILVPFLQSSSESVCSLQAVDLVAEDNFWKSGDKSITVFKTAVNLRSVRFASSTRLFTEENLSYLPASCFHLPWAQLTYISFSSFLIKPSDALRILALSTSLITCELDLADEEDPTILPYVRKVYLPNLISLTLQNFGNSLAPFLAQLDIPQFQHMILSSYEPLAEGDDLISFFTGCTHLSTLFISTRIPNSIIEVMLDKIPSLQELSIYQAPLSDSILEKMSSGDLLPKLKSLSCIVTDIEAFLDMLWSSRIPDVKIFVDDDIEKSFNGEMSDTLDRLQIVGVHLQLLPYSGIT